MKWFASVQLNPYFTSWKYQINHIQYGSTILLELERKDIIEQKLFKDLPLRATKEDVFEQIVWFTFSEKYIALKRLVDSINELQNKVWILL